MALTIAQIQNAYVAFFNRPADVAGLQYWSSYAGNSADLLNTFAESAEYKDLYAGMNSTQLVNAVYQNLFGRPAEVAGLTYWVGQLDNGALKIGNIAEAINKGSQGTDADIISNKVTAATAFTNALDTNAEIVAYASANDTALNAVKTWLNTVTSDAASVTAATGAPLENVLNTVQNNSNENAGQTVMLTKGLDNVQGTAGNDTIIGSITAVNGTGELDTLSTLDIINGGAGKDTLKIASSLAAGTALPLANISNVEVIEIEGTAGVTVNTSAVAGVTDLNVVKHGSAAVDATAAATTNIAATLQENGAGTALGHTVNGGNNVTVTAANAGATSNADTITIGGTAAAKGDVAVNVTGKAYDAASDNTFGAIAVTGGKTVAVTQKATSDASKAAADSAANSVAQAAVTVTANTDTTAVTVKQDAAVAAKNAAFTTGGQTETATVKFGALKGGDAVTINGLTFTAATGVNLTAEEVAAAFSNMVSGLANANTDTQGSQVAAKGVFTGAFATGANAVGGYTAAAAAGDTVVFTAVRANQDVATDLTASLSNTSGTSVAPTVTVVQGKAHDATLAGGVMGVTAGAVTIEGGANAAAVKTITVDGYSAAGSASKGTTSALETLNLSNGGDFALLQAAATLALNLTNVGTAAKAETLTSASANAAPAVLDLNNTATKTLNVQSNGINTVDLQLDGATGTTALNVSGSGLLDSSSGSKASSLTTIKVTESAGLSLNSGATANVTSVDTTGTTGATTLTLDGTKATYAGGAGKDSVTISNANVAITKAIDLGAGDDILTLNAVGGAAIAIPTVDLKGGEGIDTIAMSAKDAVALTANGTFASKIEGFERLSLNTKLAEAGTVNLANLDNINYVVSANSDLVVGVATKEVITVDFSVPNSGAVTGADTILFDSTLLTLADGQSAAQIATAFYGKTFANWDVTSVGGTVVTLTRKTGGDFADIGSGAFTITDVGGGDVPAVTVKTTTQGAAAPDTAAALTIDKMASGGTLELTATGAGAIVKVTDAAKGTADVLNVVTKANGDVGTVTVADIETINLNIGNASKGFTNANFNDANGVPVKSADVSSTTLAVAGNTATKAITVEGAGNLTLTVAANTKLATVDASKATGNLTLNLSTHNGDAITVTGGSGNDVLTASQGLNAKADVLIGGAGNDTLFAGSNGAKLTGGAGNDLFVLKAGNKEANTHSSILDFQAGDVLKLEQSGAATAITSFTKLGATLGTNAVFSDYANAAISQADANQAVWFQFGSNAYVVIDQATNSVAFDNGVDSIIELVGVDLANASFNSTYGTVALI